VPIPLVLAVIVADLGAVSCGVGCGPQSRYPDPPIESYVTTTIAVRVDGIEDAVKGARVTSAFLEAPGAVPLLGRSFTPDEYRQAASAVAMISEDYWINRLGGSPTIIGQRIEIDGRPRTIVGVGPPHFSPQDAQIWLPDLR
jgi:hypothetical protein